MHGGDVEMTPEYDLALLRECWIGGGVGEGALGELADPEAVNRHWARPWLRRRTRRAEQSRRTDWGMLM